MNQIHFSIQYLVSEALQCHFDFNKIFEILKSIPYNNSMLEHLRKYLSETTLNVELDNMWGDQVGKHPNTYLLYILYAVEGTSWCFAQKQ